MTSVGWRRMTLTDESKPLSSFTGKCGEMLVLGLCLAWFIVVFWCSSPPVLSILPLLAAALYVECRFTTCVALSRLVVLYSLLDQTMCN